jgi:hypothetical protein
MSMRRRSVIAVVITLLLVVDAVVAGSASKAATGASQRKASVAAQGSPLVTYLGPSKTQSIVYIARPNGGAQRRLGPGTDPLISPAGGYYVAASATNFKGGALLLYSTEGGAPRQFFDTGNQTATPLAWSPNGRYLAVALLGTDANSTRGSGLAVIDTQSWATTIVAKGIIYGASFNPQGTQELVYASAQSQLGKDPSDISSVSVYGGKSTPLIHGGRNLFPVWAPQGIIFDRSRARSGEQAPEYQVWLMGRGELKQLTSVKVSALTDGLVPLAVSANGNRILAAFVGEDTYEAWTIQLSPRKVKQIMLGQESVQPAGISSDGKRLLLDIGSFETSPSNGTVETMPFAGGRMSKVVAGADASWNA